eukprot:gene24558-biopygen17927
MLEMPGLAKKWSQWEGNQGYCGADRFARFTANGCNDANDVQELGSEPSPNRPRTAEPARTISKPSRTVPEPHPNPGGPVPAAQRAQQAAAAAAAAGGSGGGGGDGRAWQCKGLTAVLAPHRTPPGTPLPYVTPPSMDHRGVRGGMERVQDGDLRPLPPVESCCHHASATHPGDAYIGGATRLKARARPLPPPPLPFPHSPGGTEGETAEDAFGTRPFLQTLSCGTRPGRARGRFSQQEPCGLGGGSGSRGSPESPGGAQFRRGQGKCLFVPRSNFPEMWSVRRKVAWAQKSVACAQTSVAWARGSVACAQGSVAWARESVACVQGSAVWAQKTRSGRGKVRPGDSYKKNKTRAGAGGAASRTIPGTLWWEAPAPPPRPLDPTGGSDARSARARARGAVAQQDRRRPQRARP